MVYSQISVVNTSLAELATLAMKKFRKLFIEIKFSEKTILFQFQRICQLK